MTTESKYLTLQQAAELLGLAPLTIRRMIGRGDLTAVRVGSGPKAPIRIERTQIDDLLRPIPAAR